MRDDEVGKFYFIKGKGNQHLEGGRRIPEQWCHMRVTELLLSWREQASCGVAS